MALKNQLGQTVVEYILLLAVSASLVVTFYRSATFKKLFGTQGKLGRLYKQESEWGYRHAYLKGRKPENNHPKASASEHASYFNGDSHETHFFGPNDKYPGP